MISCRRHGHLVEGLYCNQPLVRLWKHKNDRLVSLLGQEANVNESQVPVHVA